MSGPHFAGHIMAALRSLVAADARANPCQSPISVDNLQQNSMDGIQQARVRLQGDPRTYRLILAPAEAPITYEGRPIGDAFAKPLGDG